MTACAIEHWHRVGQQLLLASLPQQSYHSIAHEVAGFVIIVFIHHNMVDKV